MAIEGSVFSSCTSHRFSIGKEEASQTGGKECRLSSESSGAGSSHWPPLRGLTSSHPVAHLGDSATHVKESKPLSTNGA